MNCKVGSLGIKQKKGAATAACYAKGLKELLRARYESNPLMTDGAIAAIYTVCSAGL